MKHNICNLWINCRGNIYDINMVCEINEEQALTFLSSKSV